MRTGSWRNAGTWARLSSFRSALVTGGRSGIGQAIVRALEREGTDVQVLDLADGFDVGDPRTWDGVGRVDGAFLNAGVVTGERLIGRVSDEQYARIRGANLDGVVFGVRRLAQVMHEGAIVVTASLAGLVATDNDPLYALTKHAVVGFVRSLAPTVAGDGITVHAICPGLTNTAIMGDEARAHLRDVGFPLMAPEQIAAAVVTAATAPDRSGACWVCQPGRPPVVYQFRDVPGPRTEGTEGRVPPGIRDGEPGIFRR